MPASNSNSNSSSSSPGVAGVKKYFKGFSGLGGWSKSSSSVERPSLSSSSAGGIRLGLDDHSPLEGHDCRCTAPSASDGEKDIFKLVIAGLGRVRVFNSEGYPPKWSFQTWIAGLFTSELLKEGALPSKLNPPQRCRHQAGSKGRCVVKVVEEDKLKARVLGDRSEQHENEGNAAAREAYIDIYHHRQKAQVGEKWLMPG